MKYEDYETLINEAIMNVDKAPVNLKQVLQEIKADTTIIATQTATIADNDKRIRDLQDTNMKLFLGQTTTGTKITEEKEEPTTGKEALDEFVKILTTKKEDN